MLPIVISKCQTLYKQHNNPEVFSVRKNSIYVHKLYSVVSVN